MKIRTVRVLVAGVVAAAAAVGVVSVACAPPTDPSTLNPDPRRGGPCGNGDYGCTPCPTPLPDGGPRGCWAGYSCTPTGCEENPIGPDLVGAAKDAGPDARAR